MYLTKNTEQEEKDKRKGFIKSIILHILLLLLFILPFWVMDVKEEENIQGIYVALGSMNAGDFIDNNDEAKKSIEQQVEQPEKVSQKEVIEDSKPEKEKAPEIAPTKITQEVSIVKSTPSKETKKETTKPVIKPKEEAKKVEEPKEEKPSQEDFDKAKSKFGSLFGQGSSGEIDDKKGVEDGNKDSKILEGISSGSGRIGGGLSNRGLVYEPEIKDNSQKTGKVVVKVCVNKSGKVIRAKYTQLGSTTTDAYLIKIAEENAFKYSFSASEIEEQCGTVAINFVYNK